MQSVIDFYTLHPIEINIKNIILNESFDSNNSKNSKDSNIKNKNNSIYNFLKKDSTSNNICKSIECIREDINFDDKNNFDNVIFKNSYMHI